MANTLHFFLPGRNNNNNNNNNKEQKTYTSTDLIVQTQINDSGPTTHRLNRKQKVQWTPRFSDDASVNEANKGQTDDHSS